MKAEVSRSVHFYAVPYSSVFNKQWN